MSWEAAIDGPAQEIASLEALTLKISESNNWYGRRIGRTKKGFHNVDRVQVSPRIALFEGKGLDRDNIRHLCLWHVQGLYQRDPPECRIGDFKSGSWTYLLKFPCATLRMSEGTWNLSGH